MNIKKLIAGIVMVAISYFVVFSPSSFEFLENIISVQEIVGLGFIFIIIGIAGVSMIFSSFN